MPPGHLICRICLYVEPKPANAKKQNENDEDKSKEGENKEKKWKWKKRREEKRRREKKQSIKCKIHQTTWLRQLLTFEAARLPSALIVRWEARDTWLTLSAGFTTSSNLDLEECLDALECLEWWECEERAERLPIWLIESSGVTCEFTSRSITLSGSGTSRADKCDLP